MEGLNKTTKNFIQNTQFPGRVSNPTPPEYNSVRIIRGPAFSVVPSRFHSNIAKKTATSPDI
jgi:hypothetical protein